jgi:hypothetical protein
MPISAHGPIRRFLPARGTPCKGSTWHGGLGRRSRARSRRSRGIRRGAWSPDLVYPLPGVADSSWTLVFLLVLVAARFRGRGSDQSAPPVRDVSEAQRSRLGDGLTDWLAATRHLRSQLVVLEDRAKALLFEERQGLLLTGARPRQSVIGDADLRERIVEVRSLGAAWLQRVETLSASDRSMLAALAIDVDRFTTAFSLPWRAEPSVEIRDDRSEEIQGIIDGCLDAGQWLAEIDGRLSAEQPPPYR